MQATQPNDRLIYVHDPMCSWCWGFRPVFEQLCVRLPATIHVDRLLGGLAPDTVEPMPAAMREQLEATWRRIQERIPGTRFNFDFWRLAAPRRSTWPACRAVIAARALDPTIEDAMIGAIQRAYYLEARNPSDDTTLVALAGELGLDAQAFTRRLRDSATALQLAHEIDEARRLGADSFPSLRLLHDGRCRPVAVHYTDPQPMVDAVIGLTGG